MPYRDNTDAAAQEADDHWSEYGNMTRSEAHAYEEECRRAEVNVEIFGTNTCPYCVKAKELCKSLGYSFTYKNIDEDNEAFDQLVGRIKSWKTVPQIFIGAKHIGGYDDLQKYLGDD